MKNKRFEVHEHSSLEHCIGIKHSHPGKRGHQHDGFGPAAYTIDKDEWHKATGLRGGGRKKFTARPSGPQLPLRELTAHQRSFAIITVTKLAPAFGRARLRRGPIWLKDQAHTATLYRGIAP